MSDLDGEAKQPPAKRRKGAISAVGNTSRPKSQAQSPREVNHDTAGGSGVKDRKLEDTKNWSAEDVRAYIETLFDGEIAKRFVGECVV